MGRLSFTGPKPWENDRNSPTSRLSGVITAELAGKEQGRFALFLEIGNMSAVQVNFRAATVRADFNFRYTAIPFHERNTSGNLQPPYLLRYLKACHSSLWTRAYH